MGDSRAAMARDRLPWLDDEPKGTAASKGASLKRWAPAIAGGTILIAAGAYWLGRESGERLDDRPQVVTRLGQGEAALDPPELRRKVEEVAAKAPVPEAKAEERKPAPPPPMVRNGRVVIRKPERAPAIARGSRAQDYWPATASAGASGRMVRIGTFGSRSEAKKGWRAVMQIYPGMRRIPSTIVAIPSERDGKTYYRLQMGTTSQAHSEVLCQRMRIIGQSCVVVGLRK